jgi:hypothetical protein
MEDKDMHWIIIGVLTLSVIILFQHIHNQKQRVEGFENTQALTVYANSPDFITSMGPSDQGAMNAALEKTPDYVDNPFFASADFMVNPFDNKQ